MAERTVSKEAFGKLVEQVREQYRAAQDRRDEAEQGTHLEAFHEGEVRAWADALHLAENLYDFTVGNYAR